MLSHKRMLTFLAALTIVCALAGATAGGAMEPAPLRTN